MVLIYLLPTNIKYYHLLAYNHLFATMTDLEQGQGVVIRYFTSTTSSKKLQPPRSHHVDEEEEETLNTLEEEQCSSSLQSQELSSSTVELGSIIMPADNNDDGEVVINYDDDEREGYYCSSLIASVRGLAALVVCGITVVSLGATFLSSWSSSSSSNHLNSPQEVPRGSTLSYAAAANAVANDNIRSTSNNRDLFLLSGQSNMVGHTTSGQSIERSGDYWAKIKSILEQGGNLATMEEELYKVIYGTNYKNDEVATTLTNGVMELYKSSLLNDLDTPLTHGKCSFMEATEDEVKDVSQGTVATVWNANCGHSFGHELLFSRTLELGAMNYTARDFEMVKVARGGSALYEHWYPNHGEHWNLLKETIVERRGGGDWKGFIWHQGSQAAWSAQQYGEDRSLSYLGNLTGLVDEVRQLMFQNSNTAWQCKEEIPVVIVQVGYWPGGGGGNSAPAATRTRDAQAKFCSDDPRAVLVTTDDLARYYHYDAASFLISGNRIANAYQEALGGVVTCPDRVPLSTSPSSHVPTQSPTTKLTVNNSSSSQTICEDDNAKLFKLILTTDAASSNISWTLYANSDNNTLIQSSSSSDTTEYVKRICVTPKSYKFEVSNIGEGCYEGYLRGNLIFESCEDGVHDFTLEPV